MVSRCPTRCPDTPRHWRSYPGAHRVIWHPCVMPTDMERTPPAWTVAVWQSCWKWSLGSRQTLMRSGHRCKRESSPTRPPYKFPITTVRTRAHLKRASRTILRSVCSWWAVVFRGAPVDFPDSRQAVAPCLRGVWLTVFRATPTLAACRLDAGPHGPVQRFHALCKLA